MTNDQTLRVLVVDDTIVYRKIVCDVLAELPGVEVVGVANNGKIAMSRIASLKPDLLTLDIEMPEMNGIEVLEHIKTEAPDVGAIMLSTLTQEGGEMTIRALQLGAFDFIPKPQGGTMEENKKAVRNALSRLVKAFARRREISNILREQISTTQPRRKDLLREQALGVQHMKGAMRPKRTKSEVVAIGVSTGGPNALSRMLPKLPPDLGAPVLVVQHMPPIFTQSLAKSLNSKCAIEVAEAVDGQPLSNNVALIAPGGKQMKVVAGADGKSRIVRITDDPPENSCKPSADYLFRSVAHHFVGRATGVIMTGMGSDGTLGLKLMKRNGATVIAQDEATCVVYGMPKAVVDSGIADVVVPLDRISEEILKTVRN